MTTNVFARGSFQIEPLESRTLLSASAAGYDLMSLMGYDHLGASWKYGTTGNTVNPDGITRSFSQTTRISIGSKKVKYDNHLSSVAKFATSDMSLSTAWYRASGGTFQSLNAVFFGSDGLSINLHDTCIVPKSMRIGQAFKDSGTFDGTLSFPSFDEENPLTGTFSGKNSVVTSLAKMQNVKMRAGTFNAVKGTYLVNLSGKIKIKYMGQSMTGTFAATETLTFWAVPNVGIVKQVAGLNITMAGGGETTSSTVNQTSTLVSYVMP